MKRVRLSLEVSETFVRLLQANVSLSGWLDGRQLTPSALLAVLVLGEARGATEAQIEARIPSEWEGHIKVLHAERSVVVAPVARQEIGVER